jgi:hypothetical protein
VKGIEIVLAIVGAMAWAGRGVPASAILDDPRLQSGDEPLFPRRRR